MRTVIWSIYKEMGYDDYAVETRVGTPRISLMPDGEYPVEGSDRTLKVSNGRVNTRNVKGIAAEMINKSEDPLDKMKTLFVERITLMDSGEIDLCIGWDLEFRVIDSGLEPCFPRETTNA
jgi:hypothetical protein